MPRLGILLPLVAALARNWVLIFSLSFGLSTASAVQPLTLTTKGVSPAEVPAAAKSPVATVGSSTTGLAAPSRPSPGKSWLLTWPQKLMVLPAASTSDGETSNKLQGCAFMFTQGEFGRSTKNAGANRYVRHHE